jgi:hypothetical protein
VTFNAFKAPTFDVVGMLESGQRVADYHFHAFAEVADTVGAGR